MYAMKSIAIFIFAVAGAVLYTAGAFTDVMAGNSGVPPFILDEKVTTIPRGIQGTVAPLERITAENAKTIGKGLGCAWKGVAWRNERVNAQFSIWTDVQVKNVRCSTRGLKGPCGAIIPTTDVKMHFVENVMATAHYTTREAVVDTPYHVVGEILGGDTLDEMPVNACRPLWVQVRVPADASPGTYDGTVTVSGDGVEDFVLRLSLGVLGWTLPSPREWRFFLDFWQAPIAVANHHGVEPWSDEHWRLLDPLVRELGDAGQKAITVHLHWYTPCRDASRRWQSQILRTKRKDGTWAFDYSVFDKWVAFAKERGLGPQIHCYTVAERDGRNSHMYVDGASDNLVKVKVPVISDENATFWSVFFKDFSAHLKEKGWLDDTYMALDENSLEEAKATVSMIRREGPGFKIAFACDKPAVDFLALGIENFSQSLRGDLMDDTFLAAVRERGKDSSLTTTFYVCNYPQKPNRWVTSPLCECAWLGLYAAAKGYSGFLCWSAWAWPKGVNRDASSCPPRNEPGEGFVVYPGCRSSVRWEVLRDSFENFEKIRIIRDAKASTPALEEALRAVDFKPMPRNADVETRKSFESAYRAQVEAVVRAIDSICAKEGRAVAP